MRVFTLGFEAEQPLVMGRAFDAEKLPLVTPWPARRFLAECLALPATCFSGSVLLRSLLRLRLLLLRLPFRLLLAEVPPATT